ncbi:MAG: DnaJ domain-containing protein [Crocinitomix sp.]|nr:DnaJ domain-containing protein [Crocinitomix sp.]
MSQYIFNAYELLEVNTKATIPEIKKGYKRKALEFHPDKHFNSAPANKLFQLISSAKDILLDPSSRLQHDYAIGIKQKPIITPEPEVIYINETRDETDWGSIIGAGLVGLAIGVAVKRRKKSKKRKK